MKLEDKVEIEDNITHIVSRRCSESCDKKRSEN